MLYVQSKHAVLILYRREKVTYNVSTMLSSKPLLNMNYVADPSSALSRSRRHRSIASLADARPERKFWLGTWRISSATGTMGYPSLDPARHLFTPLCRRGAESLQDSSRGHAASRLNWRVIGTELEMMYEDPLTSRTRTCKHG